jgi:hypothetical protein
MLRSPMEQEVERREMQGLMERGIVEPSESPYGTANVFVPKKALPDGTSGGLRVTADMRAVKSVTIGDTFPGEDIQTIVNWLAGKKWFSIFSRWVLECRTCKRVESVRSGKKSDRARAIHANDYGAKRCIGLRPAVGESCI